jgi:hypothetical protein
MKKMNYYVIELNSLITFPSLSVTENFKNNLGDFQNWVFWRDGNCPSYSAETIHERK